MYTLMHMASGVPGRFINVCPFSAGRAPKSCTCIRTCLSSLPRSPSRLGAYRFHPQRDRRPADCLGILFRCPLGPISISLVLSSLSHLLCPPPPPSHTTVAHSALTLLPPCCPARLRLARRRRRLLHSRRAHPQGHVIGRARGDRTFDWLIHLCMNPLAVRLEEGC